MKLSHIIMVAALSVTSSLAQAAPVFSDTFDSYSGVLNWVPQGGWTVGNGTVDLIGNGTAWDWFPANGRYLDLDGSTGQAGTLQHAINLTAGTSYTLTFDLAGSQRSGYDNNNIVDVFFGGTSNSYTLNTFDQFSTYSLTYTATSSGPFSMSFHNLGGDNVGALLDNVSVTAAVPEPESYAMMVAGLGLMGFMVRRRRFDNI